MEIKGTGYYIIELVTSRLLMTAVLIVSKLEDVKLEIEGVTEKSVILLVQLFIEVISNKLDKETYKFPLRLIFCITELTVSDF